MSTDPTQPMGAPASRSEAPQEPSAREPATQPVPKWQAPPPPPPPGQQRNQPLASPARPQEPPTVLARGPEPAVHDRVPPAQWDQTQQRPQKPQQPRQPQPRGQEQLQDARPQPPQAPGQWAPRPEPPADKQPPLTRRGRKRRVRRSVMALFGVIVLLIILVIGDRVALAVTENDMASQFTANGFPVKPSVTIQGFPFLTQLIAKDFNQVDISASNVPAGPVTINSINATVTGMHISGYSSSANAKIDHITATAFVSFGALAAAGGVGSGTGITVTQAGPNTVKITAGIGGVFSDTEEAQITQTGPQTISIKVLPSNSPVGSLLSAFGSFSFNLPAGVPASLRITNLTVNSQGLTVSAAASNATFGK